MNQTYKEDYLIGFEINIPKKKNPELKEVKIYKPTESGYVLDFASKTLWTSDTQTLMTLMDKIDRFKALSIVSIGKSSYLLTESGMWEEMI